MKRGSQMTQMTQITQMVQLTHPRPTVMHPSRGLGRDSLCRLWFP